MKRIFVDAGSRQIKYEIAIEGGILKRVGGMVQESNPSSVAIISNPTVMKFHGDSLTRSLMDAGFKPSIIIVPDGEIYKNMENVMMILEQMLEAGSDRKTLVIPFGGGVIGDMGGFAASIFMRGINYIHIPTTIIAQVDSSIGGKVGVDLPRGKNLAGSFHHPLMVITDPLLLKTLSDEEFSNGMVEVIKAAIISSPDLFDLLEALPQNRNEISEEKMEEIITEAVKIKVDIVNRDVFESGERMKLNLGHTMGHALEASMGYSGISHGKAVAIGMVCACHISGKIGLLEDLTLPGRLERIIVKFNLPIAVTGASVEKIIGFLSHDKKWAYGKTCFVLPVFLGKVEIVEDLDNNIIAESIKTICQ